MSRLGQALLPAGALGMAGHFRAAVTDARPAAADHHLQGLADQPPRYAVGVAVDLRGAILPHATHGAERRTAIQRPQGCRSAAAKRLTGTSPVVPCTRTSAISRIHHTKWPSGSAHLPNSRPAMALRFTYPTPRSSLPFVRA